MTIPEMVFLDAGILIGAVTRNDPRHQESRLIVEAARSGEIPACTSVGVLAELYAALTWVGALPPQSPETASKVVKSIVAFPSKLKVLETDYEAGILMLDMAGRYKLTARRVHDARHAATALVAGVRRVYTYDVDDWRVFSPDGIIVTGPESIL